MKVGRMWVLGAATFGAATPTLAQAPDAALEVEARVWLDRGSEPVLQLGDRIRIYYRISQDAYVAVFHLDTDGRAALVFPERPGQPNLVRGGRDYRLLFGNSAYWYVEEHPGVGYYFIVASPEPLDFSAFDYSRYERTWDLRTVGGEVHGDPFLAMDEFVARLIPEWEYVPYALDYAEYDVGDDYEYPRFLCYECHSERPFYVWDPYYSTCLEFDVYGRSDPWFYISTRYRGSYAVLPRPRGRPRYEFKEKGLRIPDAVLLSPRQGRRRPGEYDTPTRRNDAEARPPNSRGRAPAEEPTVRRRGDSGSTDGRVRRQPVPLERSRPERASEGSSTRRAGPTERLRPSIQPRPRVQPRLEGPGSRSGGSGSVDRGGGPSAGRRPEVRRPSNAPSGGAAGRPPGSAAPPPVRRPSGGSDQPAARRPSGSSRPPVARSSGSGSPKERGGERPRRPRGGSDGG